MVIVSSIDCVLNSDVNTLAMLGRRLGLDCDHGYDHISFAINGIDLHIHCTCMDQCDHSSSF